MHACLDCANNFGKNNKAIIILSDGICLEKFPICLTASLSPLHSLFFPLFFFFSLWHEQEFLFGWNVFVICQLRCEPPACVANNEAFLDHTSIYFLKLNCKILDLSYSKLCEIKIILLCCMFTVIKGMAVKYQTYKLGGSTDGNSFALWYLNLSVILLVYQVIW